jgi:hypothetical protein
MMSVHNRFCLTLSISWPLMALSLITSYNNREIRCCNPSISYVYRNIYLTENWVATRIDSLRVWFSMYFWKEIGKDFCKKKFQKKFPLNLLDKSRGKSDLVTPSSKFFWWKKLKYLTSFRFKRKVTNSDLSNVILHFFYRYTYWFLPVI